MAIINCPKCGAEVSDQAESCLNCGYQINSDNQGNTSCFIATATYGNENIVEVKLLRAFRDEFLIKNKIGQIIIWIYYNISPYIAFIVNKSSYLKKISRLILDQIIFLIEEFTIIKRNDFNR